MKLSDFDYFLPKELIAQEPAQPRDHSRLLVLDKLSGEIEHKIFFNLVDYLQPGDLLVVNDSKVFPARLIGHKEKTGGKMEIFLHQKQDIGQIEWNNGDVWECMIGGRGACVGLIIKFTDDFQAQVLQNNEDGTWLVGFNKSDDDFFVAIESVGIMPLPPYIKREETGEASDKNNYQTVYAKNTGSAAAPTAGLHFTDSLLQNIKNKGVEIIPVTLHVGLGTFAPVKTDNILEHKMHSEYAEVERDTFEKIINAKKAGKRVIAVGTTSARVIEGLIAKNLEKEMQDKIGGMINIFIYPGYQFKLVDCLITNFHLPKSTLLMLVSTLAGKDKIESAYQTAVNEKYKFFSYGDAMLIK